MLNRRTALLCGGAALAATAAVGLSRPAEREAGPSLKSLAAARGLIYGAATANYQLRHDDFAQAFVRECAILVPEYEFKRDLTEPEQGRYDFFAAAGLQTYAARNDLLFRGHPLVWYASNPPWLEAAVAAAKDERIFADYIHAAASQFRGRMHSWDVVNEAVEPDDGRPDGLRNTFWLKRFGPGHIGDAFVVARAADPRALLVYNDYGLESEAPGHDARRRATLKLLESLVARGAPIGALGLQGHITAFGAPVDQKKFAAFLDEVRAMGLRILVTEHDVDDSGGAIDAATRDRAVADASRRMLDVALDNPATVALLTWGLSDYFLKAEGTANALLLGTPRMLPLDVSMAPLPLRDAIAQALSGARKR